MGVFKAKKAQKTKRYRRETDRILLEDMADGRKLAALQKQPLDEYLPGLGQHYCVPCARYFESENALLNHTFTKVHKRRVRDLKRGPYTQEEANAAAGLDVAKYLQQRDRIRTIQDMLAVKEQLKRCAKHREICMADAADVAAATSPGIVVEIETKETVEISPLDGEIEP